MDKQAGRKADRRQAGRQKLKLSRQIFEKSSNLQISN
jgi:hypothetical protein